MHSRPSFAAAWYAQRLAASAAVSDVQDEELRGLTDAEALRRSDALLSLSPLTAAGGADAPWQDEQRRTSSGFVEQQAHFARRQRR